MPTVVTGTSQPPEIQPCQQLLTFLSVHRSHKHTSTLPTGEESLQLCLA